MCLEKRVFYRMMSGLHASINIHLSALYLFKGESESVASTGKPGAVNINFKCAAFPGSEINIFMRAPSGD